MKNLYHNGFESLYDDFYKSLIDYKKEYELYSSILSKYEIDSVLEIGCGTGNLAHYFMNDRFNYIGLDLSDEMLSIARTKNPNGQFIKGNMCDFELDKPCEATLITGRTVSYLDTNKMVFDCLKSLNSYLADNGIICFDFIDASRFIQEIKGGKNWTHQASINNRSYERQSFIEETDRDNFIFKWTSNYYELKNSNKEFLVEDVSEVRAFTKEEWELHLHLNNFEILEMIDRRSYMFDTYLVVARKMRNND